MRVTLWLEEPRDDLKDGLVAAAQDELSHLCADLDALLATLS